ncbi:arsenate reductase/protein-tyrosine-phosphatase family protein [Blastococcus sp. SYSU DS0619]
MPDQETAPTPVTVLLVCTGNICRSALGERLGRAYLGEVLGPAAGDVHLVSAGTRAVVGSRMHPDSALVLSGFGGDPAGFVARQLEARMIAAADLVLTLTRDHRRDVLELVPRALARTFTLREAADLLGAVEERESAGEEFSGRVRALVAALAAARPGRTGGADDDIADPIGRSLEGHEASGQAVAEALLPVLAAVVALHPATAGAEVPDPVGRPSHVDRSARRSPADGGSGDDGPSPAQSRSGDDRPGTSARGARGRFDALTRRRRAGS